MSAASVAEDFLGGVFVEVFITCILYGVTILQTFIYFQNYASDTLLIKSTVAVLWILETAHTICCIHFIYAYTMQEFGNVAYFGTIVKTALTTVVLEIIISLVVQGFYVGRVWILSQRSRVITAFLAFFTLARFGFGMATSAMSFQFSEWKELREHKALLATVAGGMGAATLVDIMAALTLSYYLRRWRHDIPKASRGKVDMIIAYIVNTGALTGAASLVALVLFATQRTNLTFLGVLEIHTKLYANSFLGSLNSRAYVREQDTIQEYVSFEVAKRPRVNSVVPETPSSVTFRRTMTTNNFTSTDIDPIEEEHSDIADAFALDTKASDYV